MAEIPQVQGEGSIWQGLATTGVIPEKYLVRGMDNLGQMSFITRGHNKFLHMLHSRFPKSKTVSTREHRTHQIEELDRVLTITSTQDSSNNVFEVSNRHAAQLQPNDMLILPGVYHKWDGSEHTFSNSWDVIAGLVNFEQVMVIAVGPPNSGATGNTKVTVLRGYASKSTEIGADGRPVRDFHGQVAPPPSLTAAGSYLTAGMQAMRSLPNFPEGSDAPRGFHANPEIDNNFTQEFKYAVEITKEAEIEKTHIGKSQLEIYKMLKMKQANLDIERAMLFGRKTKSMDSQGRVQYTMGGVFDYIIPDTDHMHTYAASNFSYTNMLDLGNDILVQGGGTERDFYCGIVLYNEIKKAFHDSGYLRYDEEASRNFDLPVESLIVSGGKFNVIPMYMFDEMGYGDKALVLDFSVPSFVPVTHEGWDMKVEKDIQQKGVQIYKEQWVGIKGLERRYAQYQHLINFNNI